MSGEITYDKTSYPVVGVGELDYFKQLVLIEVWFDFDKDRFLVGFLRECI